MADGGNDLAGLDEISNDPHRIIIVAENIGVDLAAGKNQRVKIIHFHCLGGKVDGDAVAPVLFIPALDFALLDGGDLHVGTLGLQLVIGHAQLRALVAVCRENEDFCSIDGSHVCLLLNSVFFVGIDGWQEKFHVLATLSIEFFDVRLPKLFGVGGFVLPLAHECLVIVDHHLTCAAKPKIFFRKFARFGLFHVAAP